MSLRVPSCPLVGLGSRLSAGLASARTGWPWRTVRPEQGADPFYRLCRPQPEVTNRRRHRRRRCSHQCKRQGVYPMCQGLAPHRSERFSPKLQHRRRRWCHRLGLHPPMRRPCSPRHQRRHSRLTQMHPKTKSIRCPQARSPALQRMLVRASVGSFGARLCFLLAYKAPAFGTCRILWQSKCGSAHVLLTRTVVRRASTCRASM